MKYFDYVALSGVVFAAPGGEGKPEAKPDAEKQKAEAEAKAKDEAEKRKAEKVRDAVFRERTADAFVKLCELELEALYAFRRPAKLLEAARKAATAAKITTFSHEGGNVNVEGATAAQLLAAVKRAKGNAANEEGYDTALKAAEEANDAAAAAEKINGMYAGKLFTAGVEVAEGRFVGLSYDALIAREEGFLKDLESARKERKRAVEARTACKKKAPAEGWLSTSTWIGGVAGAVAGASLVYGVLTAPAALAAVGLAAASTPLLVGVGLAVVVVSALILGGFGAIVNHWRDSRAATWAGAGALLGSVGIAAGSIFPSIATACLFGLAAATPLTLLGVGVAALVLPTLAVGVIGAGYDWWQHSHSPADDNTPPAAAPSVAG